VQKKTRERALLGGGRGDVLRFAPEIAVPSAVAAVAAMGARACTRLRDGDQSLGVFRNLVLVGEPVGASASLISCERDDVRTLSLAACGRRFACEACGASVMGLCLRLSDSCESSR
jgi:hypothetical protein